MKATGGARRKAHAGGPWVAGSVVAAAAAAAAAGLALAFMLGDSGSKPGAGQTSADPPRTGVVPPPAKGGAGGGGGGGRGMGRGEDGVFELDRVIRELPKANAAFNAPATLRLEEPAVIQLFLSGKRSIRRLQQQLTALGRREGARIRASDSMEANLAGTGFRIEAITPAVQPVSGAGVTEWKWEVEPTKAGTRRLHLNLSAIVALEGKESLYTVRTFERTLEVRVPLRARVSGFVGQNWQWLWTALLLPIGGWLLSRRRPRAA